MLDAYKDIESASDIPVFSGDHWAASIALKIQVHCVTIELLYKCTADTATLLRYTAKLLTLLHCGNALLLHC